MGSRGVELCERCGEPEYPWSSCGCESTTEREKRLLRVEVERVPPPEEVTARQWEEWCNAHGTEPLVTKLKCAGSREPSPQKTLYFLQKHAHDMSQPLTLHPNEIG